MSLQIIQAGDKGALSGLYRSGWECPPDVARRVAQIIADVRSRGDAALVEYSRALDDPSYDISKLRVPIPMHEQARGLVPHEMVTALALVRERVEAFHRRQLHDDVEYTEDDGTRYALRATPLESIAAYIPGGTAALASSVIMTVVPAKIAGVKRIIVVTPPQRNGKVAPGVLFACWLCDVDELYAVGGAHAIAAAAYGTASVARVDKIVGPGNVWVTEAKRQVFGACAIDGLAGPSEICVVADDATNVEYVVCELLAQAEHDAAARVAVVSESRSLLDACAQLLDAGKVSGQGTYLVHARSRQQIYDVIDRFAPAYLSLQVEDPQAWLPYVRSAGAIFVGSDTPAACGHYTAGVNHVLPTSGTARFASGLRTADFLRTYSVVENTRARLLEDAPVLSALAELEGLPQRARAAQMRSQDVPR